MEFLKVFPGTSNFVAQFIEEELSDASSTILCYQEEGLQGLNTFQLIEVFLRGTQLMNLLNL
jgi:hypothetical protein